VSSFVPAAAHLAGFEHGCRRYRLLRFDLYALHPPVCEDLRICFVHIHMWCMIRVMCFLLDVYMTICSDRPPVHKTLCAQDIYT
jgi:hypothetical protein